MSEYTVKPGESIQQAVGKLMPGDTITIMPGTYREAVTINVSGTADKPITIIATGVTIDASGQAFGINGFNARYITLQGLTIINANSGKQVNAALRTGANWIVDDVTVLRAAACGIYIGGNNCLFRRTYANDCGQLGWWSKQKRTLLKDCGAKGNNTKKNDPAWEAGGIKFYITDGVTVDGGIWSGNGGPAIWFDYRNLNFTVRNTEVYGNHGWNQAWAGVGIVAEISEGPGVIENNYVHDNTGDGIAVWESMNVTIRNNRLVNDNIGWRDMTNRAPYRTKNNTISGNQLTNGKIGTPPANANNVVSETPAQPSLPLPPATVIIGGGWSLGSGKLYLDGKHDGQSNGVVEARWIDGTLWQKNAQGSVYRFAGPFGATTQWRLEAGFPPEPTPTPPADPRDAEIAELKARVDYLTKEAAERETAISVLKAELDGFAVKKVTILFANGEEIER